MVLLQDSVTDDEYEALCEQGVGLAIKVSNHIWFQIDELFNVDGELELPYDSCLYVPRLTTVRTDRSDTDRP